MRKLCAYISIICASALLCGCGFFDQEYVVVEDYMPAVQMESNGEDKIKVSDIASLKLAIQTIINNGDTEGKIVFDAAYDGDPVTDMSKACWQVRTQDALCAYCVADISYELSKIVTYYEAKLSVGYTDYVEEAENIVHLPYSTGIEMIIRQALEEGSTRLVMLVDHSSYSAEDIVSLVSAVYRQNPATAPKEPAVSINMYSGVDMQRLYEVNMRYGIGMDELQQRKEQLSEFAPFAELDISSLDEGQRALLAYEYLCENCPVENGSGKSSVYDALIGKSADSEGIALGYIELCRQLGLECIIVYGQQDWQDHCWNIVKTENSYFHVDAGLSGSRDASARFMKTDEDFWETYRWDMSSYPACTPLPEPSLTPEEPVEEMEPEVLEEEPIEKPNPEPDEVIVEEAENISPSEETPFVSDEAENVEDAAPEAQPEADTETEIRINAKSGENKK